MFDDVAIIEQARQEGFVAVVRDKPSLKAWLLKERDNQVFALNEYDVSHILSINDEFRVGIGRASGEDRIKEATQKALSFIAPSLSASVIILITANELTMTDSEMIYDIVNETVNCEEGMMFSTYTQSEDVDDEIEVALVVAAEHLG